MSDEKYQPNIAGAFLWIPMFAVIGILYAIASGFHHFGFTMLAYATVGFGILVAFGGLFATAYLVFGPMLRYSRDSLKAGSGNV